MLIKNTIEYGLYTTNHRHVQEVSSLVRTASVGNELNIK